MPLDIAIPFKNAEDYIRSIFADLMGIEIDQVTPHLMAYVWNQRVVDQYTYLAYQQAVNKIKSWVI